MGREYATPNAPAYTKIHICIEIKNRFPGGNRRMPSSYPHHKFFPKVDGLYEILRLHINKK
jgi:hypothetical protein